MNQILRFLITPPMDGATNMALDRSILEETVQCGIPTLRIFTWARPTVSLGRHQTIPEFHLSGRIPPDWDVVVRPTGGGAVYHEHDVCFSLSWRNDGTLLPKGIQDSYREIHRVVQHALQESGVITTRERKKAEWSPTSACFTTPTTDDILQEGLKIVGGAQHHANGYVLHQGSIQRPFSSVLIENLRSAVQEHWQVRLIPFALPEPSSANASSSLHPRLS